MVLFKFAKFCLLENFNKIDIIRTFIKITNSFHFETNRPNAYYEETKSFFFFFINWNPCTGLCFDVLGVFVVFLFLIYLTKLLITA